jgi:outer membrane immunogenic protein
MPNRSFALLCAVPLLLATPAAAADFTGPWVEARGGFDSVQLKATDNGVSASGSRSGFLYGGAAGYDFSIGRKVIAGVQIGVYGTTAKACSEVYGLDEACLKAGRDLEALARLGVNVGSSTLIYGLAGYANGRATISYVDFERILPNFSSSGNEDGLRVGAGVEQAYGKTYAKLEYRYTAYRKEDLGFGANIGFNRHQVLVGAGYRF